jgi:hypothetical protein
MKIACYTSSTTMKRLIQSYKLHAITGRPGFYHPGEPWFAEEENGIV